MSVKARVSQARTIGAKVTPNQNLLVTNYQINASTIRLEDLFDVNGASTTDGAVMLYNSGTSKWVATTQIDNTSTIIDGGTF